MNPAEEGLCLNKRGQQWLKARLGVNQVHVEAKHTVRNNESKLPELIATSIG